MSDATVNITTRVEDIYHKILRLVINNDFIPALQLLETLEGEARLNLLAQFSHDLSLARARSFDLSLDLDLAFDPLMNELMSAITESQSITQFLRLTLEKERDDSQSNAIIILGHAALTIRTLTEDVLPYLGAIVELQRLIAEMRGEVFAEPTLREFSHHSPLLVSFTGTLTEAVNIVKDTIVPWRRKRAKQINDLEVREKSADVAKTQAEIEEIRARTEQIEGDPQLSFIARDRARAEVTKLNIENERMKFELYKEKFDMAAQIVDKVAPNLSPQARLLYIDRAIKSLDVIIKSALEISDS